MKLSNNYSDVCIERLVHIGLATRTTDGFESPFSFFHPSRHIPPTVQQMITIYHLWNQNVLYNDQYKIYSI